MTVQGSNKALVQVKRALATHRKRTGKKATAAVTVRVVLRDAAGNTTTRVVTVALR